MTHEEFYNLRLGDVIYSVDSGRYVIHKKLDDTVYLRYLAIGVVEVTNPDEWTLEATSVTKKEEA